jgi:hypothetical protein
MTFEEIIEKIFDGTLEAKDVTEEQLEYIQDLIADLIANRVLH